MRGGGVSKKKGTGQEKHEEKKGWNRSQRKTGRKMIKQYLDAVAQTEFTSKGSKTWRGLYRMG